MAIFTVQLKKVIDDSYPIEIGHHLENSLVTDVVQGMFGGIRKLAVITDDTVRPLYAAHIADLLTEAGFYTMIFSFPAGEKSKTREMKAKVEDEMLAAGYRRDCAVIAVGGGVVSDLAGFLAGTFARGVPFVNYATTLLAAADASVGGKTAVDTPLATNLIGLFNQPRKVYIDLATWQTLPKRQIYSGMAETIKHACMTDADFFAWLETHMQDILALDQAACEKMAKANCRIKYEVVMKDERESGLREILNLGHTVGRAIETVSGYWLLHGEAVSIGLVAAAILSEKMGHMTEADVLRLKKLLLAAHLPVKIPDFIDRRALVEKLYTDKKARNGQLRFVIPDGIGAIVPFGPDNYAIPVTEDQAREVINRM